ncbi:MAG: peptidase bleomycin hydrolase [Bacteroidetes bacterium]|jgi:bleomycin hydrolase|nr:peptidase bleomycin hydrolase [Bacteroidota bacterium]
MKSTLALGLICATFLASAQEKTNKKGSDYKFTTVKNLDATNVQNQNMTGTCWSFSSLSFLESEMIRLGKGKDYNLSEMFVARKAYPLKADNYIRMHGRTNLGEGGGFPDAMYIVKKYGMVPEEQYTGKKDPGAPHNHKMLETTIKNIVHPAALDETTKIDFSFLHNSVEAVCDEYLGKIPEKFTYKGKEYTPKTYAEATGIVPEDYVFVTSFTHHPFYSKFVLEVPDNWKWEQVHNVPLNELQEIMTNAINTGYSIAWAADVSEKGFMFADGLAIVPETDGDLKEAATKPVSQMKITQEMRQKAFDNFETQDDHGMHIIGTVKDQNGTPYYTVKNSWGKDNNQCDGYFYASESYVLYKTTSIMLHKKALPAAIAKKLAITQ